MSIYWITERLAIVARPRRDDWLQDDIKRLRAAGIDILVSALTAPEMDELGLKNEAASCEACGIEWISIPIEDRSIPRFDESFTMPLVQLAERIKSGKAVGIHCRACIGRSSLIAACLMVQGKMDPEEAFFQIGTARGCPVPDTDEQSDWVRSHVEKLRELTT
jgi:protein-tyrosine phosphatase